MISILQQTIGDEILGVNVDQNLQWTYHFHCVSKKISSCIWPLDYFIKVKSYLSMEHRSFFYKDFIQPQNY